VLRGLGPLVWLVWLRLVCLVCVVLSCSFVWSGGSLFLWNVWACRACLFGICGIVVLVCLVTSLTPNDMLYRRAALSTIAKHSSCGLKSVSTVMCVVVNVPVCVGRVRHGVSAPSHIAEEVGTPKTMISSAISICSWIVLSLHTRL
jgi:hypothetical protein